MSAAFDLPLLPAGVRVRHVHARVGGAGGPHGYLANLRQAVLDHGVVGIEVEALQRYGQWSWQSRAEDAMERIPGLRRLLHRRRGEFEMRFRRAVRGWRSNFDSVDRRAAEKLLACDLLFVHDAFLARRLIRFAPVACRERVVLVSHAPSYVAYQIAGDVLPDAGPDGWKDERSVRRLRNEENEIYQQLLAVAWPFRAAHESYDDYARLEALGRVRSVGIVTGVPAPRPESDRGRTREAWGVGERRVALFMGRSHPDKGYDRFLDWAEAGRGGDWIFAFAGRPTGRWQREPFGVQMLGYQADNGAAYCAADLILIPNRTSFLDIGLLESLSLGVPTATTATGGHREVLRRVPELIEIPSGEATTSWAGILSAYPDRATPEAATARKSAWNAQFSPRCFVRAHLEASLALLEGRPCPPE